VHSDDTSRNFAVETDELGRSVIRFGNGINGMLLPDGAEVHCWYQSGHGLDGNVGVDMITGFDPAVGVLTCWNPFDVTDGSDPEPPEQIMRNAPEAFRARQLRAVTLADYVARAEELPGVSRAAAKYMWTGSWRTVRVTIDPAGTETLTPQLAQQVADWLEAVRLLGEDLEIRPPEFVPVVVSVSLCASLDTWPEDLHFILAQEFSTGFTPDGRLGFFNPDAWTFGQALHASQIEGRLQQIPGIEHVIDVELQRFDSPKPGTTKDLEVGPSEIVQVNNDPDHMELGSITFDIRGGRQ
jgi:predicted phage baseplate assembly protein